MRRFVTLLISVLLLLTLVEATSLKGVRGTHQRHLKESKKSKDKNKEAGDEKESKENMNDEIVDSEEPPVINEEEIIEGIQDREGVIEDISEKCKKKKSKSKKSKSKKEKSKKEKSKKEKSKKEKSKKLEDFCDEIGMDREGNTTDSDEVQVGGMGSSMQSQLDGVDCEAIADDEGPRNPASISFLATMDILKEESARMNTVYTAMERALQRHVAPRIAGCSMNSNSRHLQQSGSSISQSSTIVNVDFRQFQFDNTGCDSDLASDRSGVCLASGVPVDVYYTGDEPVSLRSSVQSAIDGFRWNVSGVLDITEAEVTETARRGASNSNQSSQESGGVPPGAFGAIGAAAVLLMGGGGYYYMKKRKEEDGKKGDPDTDPDSSDDEKQGYGKNDAPMAYAQPVYDN